MGELNPRLRTGDAPTRERGDRAEPARDGRGCVAPDLKMPNVYLQLAAQPERQPDGQLGIDKELQAAPRGPTA